ncbi:MAG: hypothetical protein HOC23_05620 [Halieaceae bacterium]|jgi:hypothetical protein|nr:hypothetical protein [Halieaceae bacterium]
MINARRYLAQALLYALFFLPLVYLSQQPDYRHMDEHMAVLKLAVRHAGAIIGECTALSEADFANLPANMRRPEVCPRERSPLQLELIIDGKLLYRETVPPSGLHKDGISSMYRRVVVPAGAHHVQLLMNDNVAIEGATWQLDQNIQLRPTQVIVASFKEGFRLQ